MELAKALGLAAGVVVDVGDGVGVGVGVAVGVGADQGVADGDGRWSWPADCFFRRKGEAPTTPDSIALQERGERYRERIAGVSDRVVGHIEAMCLDEILSRSTQFEKIDTICMPDLRIERCPF
jgi:hypothetical protein